MEEGAEKSGGRSRGKKSGRDGRMERNIGGERGSGYEQKTGGTEGERADQKMGERKEGEG